MADIICRWRNGTPATVMELVNSLPHERMSNNDFRLHMQKSKWGVDFFRTPYQLACQLGLYYESDDGYYYPRFDHDITESEAQEYLEFWLPRYYVPNPYVGKNGFNNINCPTYVIYELYKYTESHPNNTYAQAYKEVFKEDANNNNDIVKNYINNYSKLLLYKADGKLAITDINPNTIFSFMDRNDKKGFFDNFSITKTTGINKELIISEKKLTDFILKVVQYFHSLDKLDAIEPYSSNTSPIKISKEGYFSLTGMFLESTIDDVIKRNEGHTRWFETPFSLDNRNVYLSTQWCSEGDYQLTLNDFVKMIHCCYGDKYVYETGTNNEYQLFLVSSSNKKNIKTVTVTSLQQIYYGAPGTGKSHRIKEQLEALNVPKENIFRTTFHPDSDFSSFVGAYKPTMKPVADKYKAVVGKDEEISYSFVPQIFIKSYVRAYQTEENVYLIIEEINRGNCAQIFGDLFQLLDRDENGTSEYTIKADADIRAYLEDVLGKDADGIKGGELCLPSNLYIYATMNTSDQSLFPIDSAFKRRWDWEYEPIKYKNTDWIIEIGGSQYSWTSFQKEVNNKIFETTNSEDKMLGDYFVNPRDGIISKELLLNKILFYLWNDVCKDGDGDIFKTDENKDVKFSDLYGDNGTNLLLSMMRHLNVSLVSKSAETADGEEVSDETAKSHGKKTLISIQLPNNPKILSSDYATQFDAFVEALRIIGIDKIISVLPSLEYKRLECPVISTQKNEVIINNTKGYSYYQEGNLFIVKGCNSYTYIRILEDLNELLNIGLSLETK